MKNVRWGIIGCGSVAEHRGGPAICKVVGSSLVAVMGRNAERAQAFARRHGAARCYDSVEDLLADADIDAVYIATPPDTHAEFTVKAALANKHVLCEKPMAMNANECVRMIEACHERRVQLMIAYYRRFYPVVIKMKQLITEGCIGKILYGCVLVASLYDPNMGWRTNPAVSGGGFASDIGSHRIDLLNYFLGQPQKVSAFADSTLGIPVDDTTVAIIRYEQGRQAVLQAYWTMEKGVDEFEIGGTRGRLLCSSLEQGELNVITNAATEKQLLARDPVTHFSVVEHLVQKIVEGKPNELPGEEGMKTTQILDALYQSSLSGKTMCINCPPKKPVNSSVEKLH